MSDDHGQRQTTWEAAARLPWRRVIHGILAVGLGGWLLWQVRSILPPFAVALFLAALLDPVVLRMTARGMPRGRAVAVIFVTALGALALGGALILPPAIRQVSDLAANITDYAQRFTTSAEELTSRADRWYTDHRDTLATLGLTETPSEFIRSQADPLSASVRSFLDTVRSAIVGLIGQVLWIIIVPLSLFYFLLDYPVLRARVIALLPAERRDGVDRLMGDVVDAFSQYVRGLTKVCVLYGSTATVLFWVLRIPYALFLGILAGVFYAVPYAGPALAVLSVAIICLTTSKGIAFTVIAVLFFVAMHVTFDYGVTPRVVGGSVGLHPLVNIFALMCGVVLFGVWGMILAVPIAASVKKVLVRLYPDLMNPPVPTETVAAANTPIDCSPDP